MNLELSWQGLQAGTKAPLQSGHGSMFVSFKVSRDARQVLNTKIQEWHVTHVLYFSVQVRLEDAVDSDKVLVLTVDGVHFRTREVRKEPSSSWYSHKHKGPGFTYEIGISIWENKLVWINGPFKAGKNDIGMFRSEGGLEARIPADKRALGDSAYKSSSRTSVKNAFDSRELKKFKNRALARHETFNGRIKCFSILENRWRHDMTKHKSVVEAVCILVQYDMENGNPLFEVY